MSFEVDLELPRRRTLDEWREMVQISCGPLHVTGSDRTGFRGDMELARLGQVYSSLIAADPHTVAHRRRSAAIDDERFIYLCQMLEGRAEVVQDGRTGVAKPGEMVVFDNSRPFTLSMLNRFRMVTLKIPHRVVGVAPPATTELTARRWPGGRGVAALVSPLLIGLSAHMSELDPATAQQVGCSIAGLITTLFSEHLRRSPQDPAAARHAMLLRVQSYAREHLGDAQLTPRALAQHHHISLRHLQKLFREQDLSPASWIRDERLNRCAADLRDPRLEHVPVALIGERWGLTAASHFSYLFRERFLMSPQEYRRLPEAPVSPATAGEPLLVAAGLGA